MIADVQQHRIENRAQWLALRKADVTASDIAAVCGVSPYSSPLQVWAEKTGQITVEENNAMRRGRWLEDGVIAAVREEHPDWAIVKPGVYLRSPSLRIGATPDALIMGEDGGPRAVLQCKVVSRPVFEAEWSDGPPIYYSLQTMTETELSNVETGYLAALVIDTFTAELEMFDVLPHPGAWGKVAGTVADFWKLVEAGGRPSADYAKDADAIATLYKAIKGGEPVDLTTNARLAELCEQYCDLGTQVKVLGEQRDAFKAEIVETLGRAGKATCRDFKISNTPIRAEVKAHVREYDRLTVSKVKP